MLAVVALDTGIDAVMHASGVYPPLGQPMAATLFQRTIAYRTVDGIAGSYIAARFAPRRPMPHALILGRLGVKCRVNKSQEFVIGGYFPGPQGFDSIIVGYYQGKDLMYVARTRNGFVPASRRGVFAKLKTAKAHPPKTRSPPNKSLAAA